MKVVERPRQRLISAVLGLIAAGWFSTPAGLLFLALYLARPLDFSRDSPHPQVAHVLIDAAIAAAVLLPLVGGLMAWLARRRVAVYLCGVELLVTLGVLAWTAINP
jgi:hypothetical protein